MIMLTGDYTTQCRKYLGLCTCPVCEDKQRELTETKRRSFYKTTIEMLQERLLKTTNSVSKGYPL